MSDRLAVVNRGRIEQIGAPADVYERPATAFVAGFVGISNTLGVEAARRVAGSEHPVTVRPEKIHLLRPDEPIPRDSCRATGVVREAIYVGALTRYVVDLDIGGELVVQQQNLDVSSQEALEARGRKVTLAWDRRHSRAVGDGKEVDSGGPGAEGSPHERKDG